MSIEEEQKTAEKVCLIEGHQFHKVKTVGDSVVIECSRCTHIYYTGITLQDLIRKAAEFEESLGGELYE